MALAWTPSLTGTNWLLMAVATLLFALNLRQQMAYRSWARDSLGLVTVRPKAFPVALLNRTQFTLEGGDTWYAGDDPKELVPSRWARVSAYSKTAFLRQPQSVFVNWVSLNEGQFYRGSFELPRARRDEVVRHFRRHPGQRDDFGDGAFVTYVVGIAAQGEVLVWVNGNTLKHRGPCIRLPLASFRAVAYTPTPDQLDGAADAQAYLEVLRARVGDEEKALVAEYQTLFDQHAFWSLEAFLTAVEPLTERREQMAFYFKHFTEFEALLQEIENIGFDIGPVSDPLLEVLNSYLAGALKPEPRRELVDRVFKAFFALPWGPITTARRDYFYADAVVPICLRAVDETLGERMLSLITSQPVTDDRLAFNLACLYATRGDKPALLQFMRIAIEHGFSPQKFISDRDFSAYQDDEDFRRLLASPLTL